MPRCLDPARPRPDTQDKGPNGPLVVFGDSFQGFAFRRLRGTERNDDVTDKATQIAALLAPTVESLGVQLLGIEYLPSPGSAVLRVYLDVPEAEAESRHVTIEDCEAVSREVSAQLDVEDPITGNYTLEVSSPGVDRPLFGAAQFARFVGEKAKVGLKLPQDGRRRLSGTIVSVEGESIVFDVDGQPVTVVAGNIDKARLVPDWAALGFAPARDLPGGDARPGKPAAKKRPSVGKKPAAPRKT